FVEVVDTVAEDSVNIHARLATKFRGAEVRLRVIFARGLKIRVPLAQLPTGDFYSAFQACRFHHSAGPALRSSAELLHRGPQQTATHRTAELRHLGGRAPMWRRTSDGVGVAPQWVLDPMQQSVNERKRGYQGAFLELAAFGVLANALAQCIETFAQHRQW